MRANSAITNVLCLGVVAGLAVWLAVEHWARLALTEERQALEQQSERMDALDAENARLSNAEAQAGQSRPLEADPPAELLRLRGEAGLLRRQNQELETARAENRQAHATQDGGTNAQRAATADYWPRDSWAFHGYGSPDASLQSSLWAANSGGLKALLAGADGALRKQMEAQFNGKSDAEASARAIDEVSGIQSVRVLKRAVQADDTVALTAEMEGRSEKQTVILLVKRIGTEWKVCGPAD